MNDRRSRFDALARLLETLASPVRLEILHKARTPCPPGEMRVAAERTREGENAERSLSRQTVAHHVDQLVAAGLLVKVPGEAGRESVVLDHARLFALVDELRALSKLRPVHAPSGDGATVPRTEAEPRDLAAPPRLLLAYGRDDAVAFPLHGPVGSRWRVGRAPSCEVALDYDPYVSGENSAVERTATGWVLHDLGSRNGTWLDWEPLRPGASRPLRPGGLVLAGRSLLVFQG